MVSIRLCSRVIYINCSLIALGFLADVERNSIDCVESKDRTLMSRDFASVGTLFGQGFF